MTKKPMAFMSYAHSNDDHDQGYITKFCERLSKEVQDQTGKEFPIFQDKKNIRWGEEWKERISSSIRSATFFIPIITPSFFESINCCDELKQFIEHEKSLDRNDLILPIYYITSTKIENGCNSDDELAKAITDHQMKDWRDLRKSEFKLKKVAERLESLAIEIRDAIGNPERTIFKDTPKLKSNSSNIQNEKYSRIVKSMPKVLIVDKSQMCCYPTINGAIGDACPGDKIIIHPGIYQEGLSLNKPLNLIGEGMRESIVVQATGQSTLLFNTDEGYITNLTFQQMGGGNWFCIDIAKGSLRLEDCDITSEGSACISVHDNANPLIRHNRIHNSTQSGILVYDHGAGIIEFNEIYENTFAGIEIKKFGNPVLRHNIIRDGKQIGIFVYDGGRGTFEDNDIFGNEFSNIAVAIDGNPHFRSNKIHDGKQNGVIIPFKGLGYFEDNEIFSNGYTGIAIKLSGSPIFRHNRIYNNKQNGIFIYEKGRGLYEDNDIFRNGCPGIAITTNGNPLVRHNIIYNNKQNGIYIFENGQGIFEGNDVFENEYPELAIGAGSDPILRHNRIHDGKRDGVLIEDGGKGLLEDNDIFSNTQTGILIKSGGNPIILCNRIKGNNVGGILILPGGGGVIEDNDLRNNKIVSLGITKDSLHKVRSSRNLEKDP